MINFLVGEYKEYTEVMNLSIFDKYFICLICQLKNVLNANHSLK